MFHFALNVDYKCSRFGFLPSAALRSLLFQSLSSVKLLLVICFMNNSYTDYTVCFEGLANIYQVMVIINFRLLNAFKSFICKYQCEISDHQYTCVEIKVVFASKYCQ